MIFAVCIIILWDILPEASAIVSYQGTPAWPDLCSDLLQRLDPGKSSVPPTSDSILLSERSSLLGVF